MRDCRLTKQSSLVLVLRSVNTLVSSPQNDSIITRVLLSLLCVDPEKRTTCDD